MNPDHLDPGLNGQRLVVTGQMVADPVILGLGIRIVAGAVTRDQQRRGQRHDASDAQPTG